MPLRLPLSPALRANLARLLFLFATMVWLNQGVSGEEHQKIKDATWVTHTAPMHQVLRYPVLFLYRRSSDEQLYHSLASAMLGAEPDRELMAKMRANSNPHFQRELPPADGKLHAPYTEVPVEYPPLLLPFVLWPRLLVSSFQAYAIVFCASMGLCLFLAIELLLRALRADARSVFATHILATVMVLTAGAISIQRLDAVIGLLLAAMIWAWQRRRWALTGLFLGLAAGCKILPAFLLLPLLAADPDLGRALRDPLTRHTAFRRMAWIFAGFGGALLASFLPLFAFGSEAWKIFLGYHGARGLHCEAVAATLLAVVSAPFQPIASATVTYGSFNLNEPIAWKIAQVLPLISVASVLALAWKCRNKLPASVYDRAALVVVVFVVVLSTGKVFSPQYLTWLLPMMSVLWIYGWRGPATFSVLVLFFSHLYFRGCFYEVHHMMASGTSVMLARVVLLVGLVITAWRAIPSALSARRSHDAPSPEALPSDTTTPAQATAEVV